MVSRRYVPWGLKLAIVARASLEELLKDYGDFLREGGLRERMIRPRLAERAMESARR